MAKLVEQLYFDKVNVGNRCSNHSQKTIGILKKVNNLEDKLMRKLSDEDKAILFDFMDAFTELASVTVSDSYANGFRQGSQFTFETLNVDPKAE